MILHDVRAVLGARLEEGTPGDPGLIGPEGPVWRVGRERALLAGGPAALLLQVAHPLVAAGVAGHSRFDAEPLHRLGRTLTAVLAAGFGDHHQAAVVGGQVAAVHRRVTGTLERAVGPFDAGTAYAAADPELALWVHATLVKVAIEVFDRLVGPLPAGDRARYYEDTKPVARLFGVTDDVLPADYAALERYLQTIVATTLAVGPEARAIASGVLRPDLGPGGRLARPLTRLLAGAFLPPSLRSAYGLPWRRRERAVLAVGAAAVRRALPLLPTRWRFWPHERTAVERCQASAPAAATG